MKIAYARVSTEDQHLDRQLTALEEYGYDKLITEKYTGTKKDREGLNKLKEIVRDGDTVIVESISRLGRNASDVWQTMNDFEKQGISVISLKEDMNTSTPTGKAMLQIITVFAELERNVIAERVREGLEAAKKRGKKLGRPTTDDSKIEYALHLHDSGKYTVKEILKKTGISQGKLYKEINNRKAQQLEEGGEGV